MTQWTSDQCFSITVGLEKLWLTRGLDCLRKHDHLYLILGVMSGCALHGTEGHLGQGLISWSLHKEEWVRAGHDFWQDHFLRKNASVRNNIIMARIIFFSTISWMMYERGKRWSLVFGRRIWNFWFVGFVQYLVLRLEVQSKWGFCLLSYLKGKQLEGRPK